MRKNRVLIMTTGGTIEKSYSEEDGSIVNREPVFKDKLLKRLRLPYTEVEVSQIMAKDSLDMTEADRLLIYDCIEKAIAEGFQCIVVLHGTDTLEKTVGVCFKKNPSPKAAVIFTGAMRPAGFDDSDAQQNFTEALYSAQIVGHGFYVSFHGHLFKAPQVTKDKERKTFIQKK